VPIKIIRPDHIELVGMGYVLLTAPHAAGPDADLHTGQIVEDAALTSRSYALIGKVSRDYIDLNRIQAARTEFRESINTLIDDNGIRCILDIHGKKEPGVDIGTALGKTCTESTINLVKTVLSKNFSVTVNQKFMGLKPGSIVTTYEKTDQDGQFLVEAVQIEFGHEERNLERDKVVIDIAELVALLNAKLEPEEPATEQSPNA
jgi:N-formylglutamate amidohydrolase